MSYTDEGIAAFKSYLGYDSPYDNAAKTMHSDKVLELAKGLEAFIQANPNHFMSPETDRRCIDRVNGLAVDLQALDWDSDRKFRVINAMFECLRVHHYCHDISQSDKREVFILDMIRIV